MSNYAPKSRLCYKCGKGEVPDRGLVLLVCRKCHKLWHPKCQVPPVHDHIVRSVINQALKSPQIDIHCNVVMDWRCHACGPAVIVLDDSDDEMESKPNPSKKTVKSNPSTEPIIILDSDSEDDTPKPTVSSKPQVTGTATIAPTKKEAPATSFTPLEQHQPSPALFSQLQPQRTPRAMDNTSLKPTSSLDETLITKTYDLSIRSEGSTSAIATPSPGPGHTMTSSPETEQTQDFGYMTANHETSSRVQYLPQPIWLERALQKRDAAKTSRQSLRPLSNWEDKWKMIQERRVRLDISSSVGSETRTLFNFVRG